MPKIEPYVHHCVVQEGDGAGNKVRWEVSAYEFEYEEVCPHCDLPLASPAQLLAHIYQELLDDE